MPGRRSRAYCSLSAKSVVSTTFSGHSTRSSDGSGCDRLRSPRGGVRSPRVLGTSSARVPCSPPPWTAAMSRVAPGVAAARSDDGQHEHHDDAGGRRRTPASPASPAPAPAVDDRAEREADLEHDPRQQDHAADAGHAEQRTADLADAEAGQRHAAEREREAQRLDERVRGRATDHAASARSARRARRRPWKRGEDQRRRRCSPGTVSCHIQPMPMAQPAEPEQRTPRHQRGGACRARRRGTSSNSATPTNASGQHPHGGIDRATTNPAAERQRRMGQARATRRARAAGAGRSVVAFTLRAPTWTTMRSLTRARGVAGEERGGGASGSGRRSTARRARRSRVEIDVVDEPPGDVDMMTSSPATRSSRWRKSACVARAVPGDDDVADLAGHRRAGPVAGAVVRAS